MSGGIGRAGKPRYNTVKAAFRAGRSGATLAKMDPIAMTAHTAFLRRLLLLGLLATAPGLAFAQNATAPTTEALFTIENVPVDATAESGTAARDQGLAAGEAEAWRRLLRRIALSEDFEKAASLSPIERERVVRDIAVVDERIAATRYRAGLTVRFRPDAARAVLAGRGVQFSDLIGPTTLILPVWRVPETAAPAAERGAVTAPPEPGVPAEGGDADPNAAARAAFLAALPPPGTELLWDDPNPWRQAWETMALPLGLVPLVVPLGDIADVADINVDAAVLGDPVALPAIAQRYGAQNVAVMLAAPQGGTPAMPEALEITVVNHTAGIDLPESTVLAVTAPADADDAAALYAAGVEAAALDLAERWKRQNTFGVDSAGALDISAAIERLEEWAEIRRRLDAVPLVAEAVPSRLALGEVRFTLRFRGDERQLALALSRQGLMLSPPAPNAAEALYRLRLGAAVAPL
jgi:hypothetical protein